MEALLPEVSLSSMRSKLPVRIAPKGAPRMRVGLMLGCVQRVFFDDVNVATARVLAAEGCEVIIPREQSCCGALMTHAGKEPQAIKAARRLIDTFERARVDAVVINAAGCGSNIKEYGRLLQDDPKYAERARSFAAKCKDISEILAELGPSAIRHPLPLRVAYQDACHLQHAQAIRTQPRQLLASIPQLQVLEIAESAICCGSAGIYNLVEPRPASELGERKVRNVLATGADVVVSANPGCLLQMKTSMRKLGTEIPALHIIELLDAAIRGVQPIATPAPSPALPTRRAA
jgi:glycolate oxidase iron-sulfur subunit